jgi:hypothetical protein
LTIAGAPLERKAITARRDHETNHKVSQKTLRGGLGKTLNKCGAREVLTQGKWPWRSAHQDAIPREIGVMP